jgi:hypothetical protein
MIKFENVGYFKKSIYLKKPPSGFIYQVKYILKFIFLNIKAPLNNSIIHFFSNWIIIDCNLEFNKGEVYNLIGDNSFKKNFKNMLTSPKKGKILGKDEYKIIEGKKNSSDILEGNLLIDINEADIDKFQNKKNIVLIFSSAIIKSNNPKIINYRFKFNRLIKC